MEAAHQRVLFLDIDGVLNTSGAEGEARPYVVFDDALMLRLGSLLERSGARIVLSTSWRKHLSYLNHVLASYGLLGPVSPRSGPERPIASEMRTPVFADPRRRDLEILRWLQMHQDELGVEGWVALDDMDLLAFPDTRSRLERRVVRTDPAVGLTETDVELALALFDAQGPAPEPRSPSYVGDPGQAGPSEAASRGPLAVQPFAGALRGALAPMDEELLGGMSAILRALDKEKPEAGAWLEAHPLCRDGHPLRSFQPACTGFCCEECGEDLAEGAPAFRCEACDGQAFCRECTARGFSD
mmetsp:Transcript_2167/g.6090  ORF Transcript_2167/g.6090 Transcript_2167/m.6090 type:complete len:299 (-) Transcript_2167:16-912(-)